MKQDSVHNHRIDRGWGKMQSILEAEMPLKKKNRRVFLWILFSLFFLSLLLSQTDFLSTTKDHNNESIPINQQQNLALVAKDNLAQAESLNEDIIRSQKDAVNTSTKQSQISNTPSITALANTIESETNDNGSLIQSTESQAQLTSSSSTEKQSNNTSNQAIPSDPVLAKLTNDELNHIASEENSSNEDYMPADEIVSMVEEENEQGLSINSETGLIESSPNMVIPGIKNIPTLTSSFILTRDIPHPIFLTSTLPVIIKKDKAQFFSGISVAGVYSSQLDLKGWNAGLHLGLTKNKIAVSVYGKLGMLKRNGITERDIISGVETMEADLTMGIEFDTIAFSDNIVEKFKVLETGLSLDYSIMPRTFVNISSGIDYYFNAQTQNRNLDMDPSANANIFAINEISGPTTIEKNVVPFISLGMSYAFIGNLQVEINYKRQIKKPLRDFTNTYYVHQYNLGLKYFF